MSRTAFGIFLALALLLASSLVAQSSDTSRPTDSAGSMAPASTAPVSLSVDSALSGGPDSVGSVSGILTKDGVPLYPLSPERRKLLADYADMVNIWRFVELFSGLLVIGVILFFGLSARFRDWAGVARLSYLKIWLYCIILFVAMSILSFPFDYYRDFHLEVQYGFMNQTFGEWMGEQLKSLIVSLVIIPVPVFFLYFVIQRFKRWWLAFSLFAFPFMVLFIVIAPVLISPIFNKFEPLKDKALEKEILTLASHAGIEGSDVFEVDASRQSSKVNAYVTGLLNTKRIVLYDTLIKGFTYNEIKFVMGHEMGHYLMKHIWWGLGLMVFYLVAVLWLIEKSIHSLLHRWRHAFRFERMEDIASLPLVLALLSVFMFFLQPVQNYASRYMEHKADIFGMDVTTISGDEAASAFDKLSAYNLSDPDPNPIIEFWFYDHPTLVDRMAFVRQYRAEHPIALKE